MARYPQVDEQISYLSTLYSHFKKQEADQKVLNKHCPYYPRSTTSNVIDYNESLIKNSMIVWLANNKTLQRSIGPKYVLVYHMHSDKPRGSSISN